MAHIAFTGVVAGITLLRSAALRTATARARITGSPIWGFGFVLLG